MTRKAVIPAAGKAYRNGRFAASSRMLAEETAVAISYNGTSHAVLMATPADLADLATGFTLSEGIALSRGEIEGVTVVDGEAGIDVQVRLVADAEARLAARRRAMAGPVGCGMCGLESIEAAMRDVPPVNGGPVLTSGEVGDAVSAMANGQVLNRETRAVHAASLFVPGTGLVTIREDVGRHNALDKLIGAAGPAQVAGGAVVMSSRVSVELVQKCAVAGCPVLIGVSAPTALAVRTAAAAGITLVAIARGEEFEVFCHPERIDGEAFSHVA